MEGRKRIPEGVSVFVRPSHTSEQLTPSQPSCRIPSCATGPPIYAKKQYTSRVEAHGKSREQRTKMNEEIHIKISKLKRS
ncbi:DUF927 domain-containing protein [Sesbania bispinosa]|nr:DUF927 domain-containing protein [Sesbania bispinosa]